MKAKKICGFLLALGLLLSVIRVGILPAPVARALSFPITGNFGQNHTYSIDRNAVMTIKGTGPMTVQPGYSGFPREIWVGTDASGRIEVIRLWGEIRKVVISEGATTVGAGAFSGYVNLEEVSLPSTVKAIYDDAFNGCKKLKKVKFGAGLTEIGAGAFAYCEALTSLTLPKNLEKIGKAAFLGCSGLTSVTLPDRVTTLGSDAFSLCTNLASFSYGPALKQIGGGVFSSTPWLNAQPKGLVDINGCAVAYTGALPADGRVVFPAGTVRVCDRLMKGRTGLIGVTLPSSVTTIGSQAFEGCSSLREVVLSEGLRMIEGGAFKGCAALTEIRIPSTVESIWGETFSGSGLRGIRFSMGLKTLGAGVFNDCEALKCVVLPQGLTRVEMLFRNCPALEEVDFPGSVSVIPQGMFNGCPALKTVIFGSGTHTIQKNALVSCGVIDNLYLPASIRQIGAKAFPSVRHAYYEGSEEQWAQVSLGSEAIGCGAIEYNTVFRRNASRGDADGDGSITASDARLALRRSVKLETFAPESEQFLACDADGNGEVTAADARLILRAAVSLEDPRTW